MHSKTSWKSQMGTHSPLGVLVASLLCHMQPWNRASFSGLGSSLHPSPMPCRLQSAQEWSESCSPSQGISSNFSHNRICFHLIRCQRFPFAHCWAAPVLQHHSCRGCRCRTPNSPLLLLQPSPAHLPPLMTSSLAGRRGGKFPRKLLTSCSYKG